MISSKQASESANAPPGSITLGGETFLVHCPTKQDMAAILLECKKISRGKRAAKVVEFFREFKDMALSKELADLECPETTDEPGVQANAMLREVMEPAGAQFAAFLILRRAHPEITMARIRELVTADNAAAVGSDLLLASGLMALDPNSIGVNGSPLKPAEGTQPSTESSPSVTSAAPESSSTSP